MIEVLHIPAQIPRLSVIGLGYPSGQLDVVCHCLLNSGPAGLTVVHSSSLIPPDHGFAPRTPLGVRESLGELPRDAHSSGNRLLLLCGLVLFFAPEKGIDGALGDHLARGPRPDLDVQDTLLGRVYRVWTRVDRPGPNPEVN